MDDARLARKSPQPRRARAERKSPGRERRLSCRAGAQRPRQSRGRPDGIAGRLDRNAAGRSGRRRGAPGRIRACGAGQGIKRRRPPRPPVKESRDGSPERLVVPPFRHVVLPERSRAGKPRMRFRPKGAPPARIRGFPPVWPAGAYRARPRRKPPETQPEPPPTASGRFPGAASGPARESGRFLCGPALACAVLASGL